MSELQSLFLMVAGLGVVMILIGWKLDKTLEDLIEVTRRKSNASAWTYLEHARTQIQYADGEGMATYWLLLAIVSLLSDEEF